MRVYVIPPANVPYEINVVWIELASTLWLAVTSEGKHYVERTDVMLCDLSHESWIADGWELIA